MLNFSDNTMPWKCAVKGCTNNRNLHGSSSEDQCMLWKQTINYSGKLSKQSFRICSNHFSENQIQRDLQHELLGLPARKRLTPNALPDRHLSIVEKNNLPTTPPEYILPDFKVRITKFYEGGMHDSPVKPLFKGIICFFFWL